MNNVELSPLEIRSDIAMRFATTTDYPSWGYMSKNGTITIWELQNSKSAGPVMNSWNHVYVIGDLLVWLYENVAGCSGSLQLAARNFKLCLQ